MLRYQVFTCWGVVWASIWYRALQLQDDIVAVSRVSPEETKLLILLLPLWILVALAIYALSCILYGLAILGDFPDAATALEEEVREAKLAMKQRGVPIVE